VIPLIDRRIVYFALGPALVGLVVHMMWSALYGMIFGLIVYATHLKGKQHNMMPLLQDVV
jgi:hypothetical protein